MHPSNIDATPDERKRLFGFLAQMGLLASPQGAIDYYRKHYPLYVRTDLSDDDINGISYLGAHFSCHPRQKDFMEIWIGNYYVHPDTIEWVDINPLMSYGILDRRYPGDTECKIFYNPDTVFRHHKIEEDDSHKMYVTRIDISQPPYNSFNLNEAVFYISQNKVYIAGVFHISDSIYEIRAPYKHDIDLFVSSNLARTVRCDMWVRQYLTSPTSNKLYCGIIIDHSDKAPIDARYYPAVLARGIVRAYTIGCREYLYPFTAYLINYKEFMNIDDPYHPMKEEAVPEVYEFIRRYKAAGADDVIHGGDSINTMYKKLAKICAGCYNVCDKLPPNYEPANFLICDNSNMNHPTFVRETINDQEVIRSAVPKQDFRDIILYGSYPYTGQVDSVHVGKYEYYILPAELDENQFTLIKFNAYEDTHLMNASDYLVKDNFLNLKYKLNRFYRNMMILRMQVFDETVGHDQVYVGTTEPDVMDEHLWYEYILNVEPEEFETKAVTIHMNRDTIPEPIKKGAYTLDLPDDAGEDSYSTIMDTYFKLTKYYYKHLVMTHGTEYDDPNTQVLDTIQLGSTIQDPDIKPNVDNELLIDAHVPHDKGTRNFHYFGEEHYPDIANAVENDLYVRMKDSENPTDPNVEIDQVEYGDYMPEKDENTLWVDPINDPGEDALDKDSLDSVSTQFMVGDNADNILNPEFGAYAIDGLKNMMMQEVEPSDEGNFYDVGNLDESVPHPAASMLDSIMNIVQEGLTIDEVEDPTAGMYALEMISGPDMGKVEDVDLGGVLDTAVAAMTVEEKRNFISKYITDDDMPKDATINDWWFQYESESSDWELNTIVKKIILTKSAFALSDIYGDLAIEGATLPEDHNAQIDIGDNEYHSEEYGQLLIKSFPTNADGSVILDYDYSRKKAIRYIMSLRDPDAVLEGIRTGDLWLNLKPFRFDDLIDDVLSSVIYECGQNLPDPDPAMELMDDLSTYKTTAILDFGLHGDENMVRSLQGVKTELHPAYNGERPSIDDMNDHDIWYEWIDKIAPAVCYSAPDTLVLRIDDHLYGVEFGPDENVDIFCFDDIVLHFNNHERGVKYLAILADLMESKIVHPNDTMIFYQRLMTCRDHVDPHLKRLYGRESNVISTLKTDYPDMSMVFSMNIGRFTMDYRTAGDREQENAYKMIIDLRDREFAYIPGRMLLFINGQYIHPNNISEPAAHLIQIENFHEVIACVDIFYYKRDEHIINIKRLAADHWPIADRGEFVDPKTLTEMEFVELYDKNYKGYYDVLYREYIENGYLVNRIAELMEANDTEGLEDLKEELLFRFQDITDKKLFEFTGDNKIVIPANNHGRAFYEIH